MPNSGAVPGVGSVVADKYKVVRILGSGGMGTVLEVSHVVTGKHFALKWLLPEADTANIVTQRFVREAQVAGRVHHSNVVEVYDIGQQDGCSYMVMELLRGESLQAYISERGPISIYDAVDLLLPVLQGVGAAHRAGVVHRDLKPDNIFLSVPPEGSGRRLVPKVVDFGISKIYGPSGPGAQQVLTHAGAVIGTPHYMAPEQMRGEPADALSDIYALGTILYRMVSGELPYDAESFPDLVFRVATQTPAALAKQCPTAPPEFVAIVETAMAKRREDRFGSIDAFVAALAPFRREQRAVDSASYHPASRRAPASPGPKTPLALCTNRTQVRPRLRYPVTRRYALWGVIMLSAGATAAAIFVDAPHTKHATGAVQPAQPPAIQSRAQGLSTVATTHTAQTEAPASRTAPTTEAVPSTTEQAARDEQAALNEQVTRDKSALEAQQKPTEARSRRTRSAAAARKRRQPPRRQPPTEQPTTPSTASAQHTPTQTTGQSPAPATATQELADTAAAASPTKPQDSAPQKDGTSPLPAQDHAKQSAAVTQPHAAEPDAAAATPPQEPAPSPADEDQPEAPEESDPGTTAPPEPKNRSGVELDPAEFL